MRPRAGWMVMGKRGRPSALDVCRVLAVFLSLFPVGKMLLLTFFQIRFKIVTLWYILLYDVVNAVNMLNFVYHM